MGYLFLAIALTLNATANLLMKAGADRVGVWGETGTVHGLLTNYYLLGGLVLFALNVAFYVAALTRLHLSIAYPVMMAGGVVIVVTVALVYFKETLSLPQSFGILLIIAGITLVTSEAGA